MRAVVVEWMVTGNKLGGGGVGVDTTAIGSLASKTPAKAALIRHFKTKYRTLVQMRALPPPPEVRSP